MNLEDLITKLNTATKFSSVEQVVSQVREVLLEGVRKGLKLPERCLEYNNDHYSRHLLHRDAVRGYSVVAMVWGPGQCTDLHDHDHLWCVECVTSGELEVTRYDHVATNSVGNYIFQKLDVVNAQVGQARHLIPPFEHHTMANASNTQAATSLNVYGGDMKECSIFIPQEDGSFKSEKKTMRFDSSLESA